MAQHLIDFAAGCFRPVWTNMDVIGFLVDYLDSNDQSPAEDQMIAGYENSAGFAPYAFNASEWAARPGHLLSLKYKETFDEVSRCTAGDGSTVIMYDSAMTSVIRDDQIVWLARLD